MKINIFIITAILLGGIIVTLLIDKQSVKETNHRNLPDIEFTLLDGTKKNLSEFNDKPVIVHFWATWCAPCIIEYPNLMKMAKKQKNDVFVITVAVQNDEDQVNSFFQKNKISTIPNVAIALDKNWRISKSIFGTTKLPESFLISRKQEIIKRHNGPVENWVQMPWINKFNDLQ